MKKCRLCQEERDLQDSHLLPKSMYRLLRSSGLQNNDPLIINQHWVGNSSGQYKNLLLCKDCEDRFSSNGETWVMQNCWRAARIFPLRDQLLSRSPVVTLSDPEMTVYASASVPTIRPGKVLYFAASVFWRAAVHKWRIRGLTNVVQTQLGPYEEPLRQFLREHAAFPQAMALIVFVRSPRFDIPIVLSPQDYPEDGYRVHSFAIPGIEFFMFVGEGIPAEVQSESFSGSHERPVIIAPNMDLSGLEAMARHLANAGVR